MKFKLLLTQLTNYLQLNSFLKLAIDSLSFFKHFLLNLFSEPIQEEPKFDQHNKLVDQLIQECYSKGLTKDEVHLLWEEYVLGPFRSRFRLVKMLHSIKNLLILSLIVSSLVWLCPSYRPVYYILRIILLKILPFIDWTTVYKTNCLMNNPFYKQTSYVSSERCNLCADLIQVARSEKIDYINVENYIFNEIPFIIDSKSGMNELKSWSISSLDLNDIKEIYSSLPVIDICMFQSNIKSNDPIFLIDWITKYKSNWYAHWENCGIVSKKTFRKYYTRPWFMPLYVELTLSNWIIVSSNFTTNTWKYIDVDVGCKLATLVQVKGAIMIKLEPNQMCSQSGCKELFINLKVGDFFTYAPDQWKLLYLPKNTTFNLSFMIEGNFESPF